MVLECPPLSPAVAEFEHVIVSPPPSLPPQLLAKIKVCPRFMVSVLRAAWYIDDGDAVLREMGTVVSQTVHCHMML